ncbi:MAG: ferrous iron transport protein B [Candidatus Korarchaeota archaeon NZ13-K]|nr:MAG: ferrous iron transport protein B [Candidatus Korarchaeota archaeon NZ13-K]
MRELLIGLAGSPNVGKSTLFNRMTGGNVHVANWAGVTLQRFEGVLTHGGVRLRIVDLPGIYSLSARDPGERIARDFIIRERPDALILVVDATSLEKSLYLAVSALELYGRVVIALNMMDAAEKRGIHVNAEGLEGRLGVPVVPISALKGIGIGKLLRAVMEVAEGRSGRKEPLRVDYDGLERFIARLERVLREGGLEGYPTRWAAVRLLEGDDALLEEISRENPGVADEALRLREEARRELAADPESLTISSRYELIEELLRENVRRVGLSSPSLEEALDSLLLHPMAGPLASISLIMATFLMIFTLNTGFPANIIMRAMGLGDLADLMESYSLTGLLGSLFDTLSSLLASTLRSLGLDDFSVGLISEGILGSLGTLLSFIPLLLITYMILGALQDSGVFPRAATSLDSFFRRFGLSGRSFFPAAVGLGCSVPAVVATRGLEDEEERILVGMTEPFIPCQARLIVLVAIAAAAFPEPLLQASLMLSIYLIGILMFLISSKLLRLILFGSRGAPELLMELPPYHVPSMRVVWWYAKANTLHFLRKAGLIIVLVGALTWLALNTGPAGYSGDLSGSFASMIGGLLAPALSPAGLNDWRIALALEAGFVAKEGLLVVFSSLSGTPDPVAAIRAMGMTPLRAASLALLMSFYVPCVATLSTILSELRRVKYVLIAVLMELSVAFLLSSLIHLIGSILGFD